MLCIVPSSKYSIEYKNTTQHGNADGLSHLPLKKAYSKEVADPAEIFQGSQLEVLPVNADKIRQATQRDLVLSRTQETRVATSQSKRIGTILQKEG